MKILKLILESKKSDAVQYFTEKYPNSESLFEELFSFDPTGHKYIDYIKRWLESYIDKYDVHFSTGFRPDELFSWFENVRWFEKNYRRIKFDDIEKLFDVAKTNMEPASVLREISKIGEQTKTDINRYPPSVLRYLREVVDGRLSKKDLEALAADGSELVFEDKNVAVIQVKTHAASCYYGSESKWCTAQLRDPNYFLKETQDYKLYYVIDRTNRRPKVAVQVPYRQGNRIVVWSSDNNKQPLNYLFDTYPETETFFEDMLSKGGTFQFLRVALQKKQEFPWFYEFPDPLINSIKNNVVKIKFEDGYEEFFKSLFPEKIDDYDMAILHSLFASYSDTWEFDDWYTIGEDWNEGYLFNTMNSDDLPRFLKLISILYPEGYADFKDYPNAEHPELASKINDSFESDVDRILNEIYYSKNREKALSVQNFIKKEYCDMFESEGFKTNSCFYTYEINVSNLLLFLAKYSPKGTILDAMKKYVETKGIEPPSELNEVAYNYYGNEMSEEEYYGDIHNAWSKLLDKMEEFVEESFEDPEQTIEGLQERLAFIDKILKKFKLNEFYEIPSGGGSFAIKNWNVMENEIEIIVKSENGEKSKRTLQLDEFYPFLYNYKLF